MKFTGKVTVVGLIREGTSKTGNKWVSQQFVMEEVGDVQYPTAIAFDVMNDKIALTQDEVCTVHLSFSVNGKDGKYFTSISAWRKEGRLSSQPAGQYQAPAVAPGQVQTPAAAATPATSAAQDDDLLPF